MASERLYPHGHNNHEKDRLDLQATIHHRPGLDGLLTKADRVLDLGCGIGSNLQLLRSINSSIRYTGTDISDEAIASANDMFADEDFRVMDATISDFDDGTFDFIFCNLVLWATGDLAPEVCREAFRILKPGGVMYSFEPDGKTLTFYPEKFAIQEILGKWERKMISLGLDPFVGRKVNSQLQSAGFSPVETFLYPKISVGTDGAQYESAAKNLAGVYLGPGASFFDLPEDDTLWVSANQQFSQISPEDLILESYYVNIGRKADH